MHPHIETGGNLFGLWTTTGSVVIHVVLGPGQHCRRTNTSFHQDLEYMGRVGRFVNDNYMLCHIGEWHSHHNLSLSKPSAGDESTIRRNFPQGMSKFLVIIANIRNGDTIQLSPYFFTDGGTRYELAERVVLDSDSPFSTDDDIVEQINEGAEGKKHHFKNTGNRQNKGSNSRWDGNTNSNQSSSLLSPSTFASKPKPSSSNPLVNLSTLDSQVNPTTPDTQVNPSTPDSKINPNTPDSQDNPTTPDSQVRPTTPDSQVNQSTPDSQVNPTTPDSQVNPTTPDSQVSPSTPDSQINQSTPDSQVNQSTSESQANPNRSPGDHVEPMDTDYSDLHPPEDYENVTSASQPGTSAAGKTDEDLNKNDHEGAVTVREILLRKIHDEVKKWFGSQSDSIFKFEKSKNSPGAVEISFKHNKKFWMVRCLKDFPIKPAELFCSMSQDALHISMIYKTDIVKPLNSVVNILLTIKNRCNSSKCGVCEHFTKDLLSQSNFNPQVMEKLVDSATKLEYDITMCLALSDVDDLKVKCASDSQAEITFKHGGRFWIIDVPAYFPDVPANVYYLAHEGSSQKCDAIWHGEHSCGRQALNTSELIIKAIHFTCFCRSCFNARQKYQL